MNPLPSDHKSETPFEIETYTREKLIEVIVSKSEASSGLIEAKNHVDYLDEYFHELGAKTILVENNYFDRDYLEDYAAHYARCFHRYRRRCTRLHFFSDEIRKEQFLALLRRESVPPATNNLQLAYLGFLVVRPLPSTIIGRTCLKTYSSEDRRCFPTTRRYEVNLFGFSLSVESLAFQEQDQAVAACATSALWSAFQKTGLLFQHPIPSPVDITRAANERFPMSSRGIPSQGLTPEQMAGAIRSVGLEPFLIDTSDPRTLKQIVYAYVNAHIPILFLFKLYRVDSSGKSCFLGGHAVTVTGFSVPSDAPIEADPWRCQRIDKIYVHDDQVGPFARMVFDDKPVDIEGQNVSTLDSAWSNQHRVVPQFALIPLYHKIRMSIEEPLIDFLPVVKLLAIANKNPFLFQRLKDLELDLSLTSLNDFRSDCLNLDHLSGQALEQALCASNPRFLWRARIRREGVPCLDCLYDATDIQQGHFFLRMIEYDPEVAANLRILANLPECSAILQTQKSQLVEYLQKPAETILDTQSFHDE